MAVHRGLIRIHTRWPHEDAQTMAEYVVVLAVITPLVILAFATLNGAVVSAFNAASAFL
jgi:Flp pilus assembly pilin Flp